jgi:hypothetical protein
MPFGLGNFACTMNGSINLYLKIPNSLINIILFMFNFIDQW